VSPWETEARIAVGGALKAGERLLYPILKVEVLHSRDDLLGLWVIPLAVLVVEQEIDFLISLHREEAGPDELEEIAPSLKAIVEEARRAPHPSGLTAAIFMLSTEKESSLS
jgi:hypothetical protein